MGDGDDEMAEIIQDDQALMPEDVAENNEMLRAVEAILDTLTERERKIIVLRYGLEGNRIHTLDEIAIPEGVTRERIRQVETKTMEKIRKQYKGDQGLREHLK